MGGYFVSKQGDYYEGDQARTGDIAVPRRPGAEFSWNGKKWIKDKKLENKTIYKELDATDMPLIRVLEDLVSALVSKGVISLSDLPGASQDKLSNRKAIRDKIKP